jgi:hypothetical protein
MRNTQGDRLFRVGGGGPISGRGVRKVEPRQQRTRTFSVLFRTFYFAPR